MVAENQTVIKELVLIRTFDAPREMVFKAWIDRDQLKQWWAPKNFTNPRCEIDPRPNGAIDIIMRSPDGTDYPCGGTYHEIDPPKRLVFTTTAHFDDETKIELEVLNTVDFAEIDGKTRLTLTAQVVKASPAMAGAMAGMDEGWSGSLDKLKALLYGDTSAREIALSRVFDAPRELVFDAYTQPEHLQHWWGPNGFSLTTYEHDLRVGGIWRLCMHGPDGRDYQNRIVYNEVEKSYRLGYAHVPDKDTEPVSIVATVTFEAYPEGKTNVNIQMLFQTAEIREVVANTYGAVEGLDQTWRRMAEYLATKKE
jgi:uncharacterized protein YndB with AHSA1/START domain